MRETSRPSRYTRLRRVILCNGILSLRNPFPPPLVCPRKPPPPPSTPFSPPILSGRCKFHYWPTDSAALNASTYIEYSPHPLIRTSERDAHPSNARLPSSPLTRKMDSRVSFETAEKNPRRLTSRSSFFLRAPSREKREKQGKEWSALLHWKRKRDNKKDILKKLRLLYHIATI